MPGVATVTQDWEGSVRGRVGVAFDRFLAYGTGGIAFTGLEVVAPAVTTSETRAGWTLGAGLEYAFTDNVTFRGEYRYSDFGSDNYAGVAAPIGVTNHALRFGLNYKF